MARSRRRAVEERQELKTDKLLQSLKQVTVATHGFQCGALDGDSLKTLAEAVYNRTGSANTWLLDYDVVTGDIGNGSLPAIGIGERGQGQFDLDESKRTASNPTNLVVLWDWAPESNERSAGWTGASADALCSTMVGLGLVKPEAGGNFPVTGQQHKFSDRNHVTRNESGAWREPNWAVIAPLFPDIKSNPTGPAEVELHAVEGGATNCLNFRFSSPRFRSHRNSATPSPASCFFHREKVCSLNPSFRLIAAPGAPDSACLNVNAICSSV